MIMPNYQGFYNGVPLNFSHDGSEDTDPNPNPNPDPGDEDTDSNTSKLVGEFRPKDWLPMPVPKDNEIYMLILIPDGGSTLLAFKVTSTAAFTVEFGTVENDEFVYMHSGQTVLSGTKISVELNASDFKAITHDGMKQVMMRISCANGNIRTWNIEEHTKRYGYGIYPIFDIRCRLPQGEFLKFSNEPDDTNHTMYQLQYFSWEGPNNLTDASKMFYSCYSLRAIWELDTSKVTKMDNMFRFCYDLVHIPELNTSQVTSMEGMFYNCYSLRDHPDMDTSKVTNMKQMFRQNVPMIVAPKLDYSAALNMEETFMGCMSLKSLPNINIAKVTNMTDTFKTANSLSFITFDPTVEGWAGCDIDLSSKHIGRDAALALFESLPAPTTQRTLNVRSTYGVDGLTTAEKDIARNKNWKLTLS